MEGAVWILSYLVLAFMVVGLTLAVGALYRLMGRPTGSSSTVAWPLTAAGPMQPLPAIRLSESPSLADSDMVAIEEGFCVLAPAAPSAHAVISSTQLVATACGQPLLVVLEAGVDWASLSVWPSEWRDRVAWTDGSELRRLGLRDPVVVFLQRGKVADAAAGLLSPSAVRHHFELVSQPLVAREEVVASA